MRRLSTIAGAGVITACLVGWAALAWAQPGPLPVPIPTPSEATLPPPPPISFEAAKPLAAPPLADEPKPTSDNPAPDKPAPDKSAPDKVTDKPSPDKSTPTGFERLPGPGAVQQIPVPPTPIPSPEPSVPVPGSPLPAPSAGPVEPSPASPGLSTPPIPSAPSTPKGMAPQSPLVPVAPVAPPAPSAARQAPQEAPPAGRFVPEDNQPVEVTVTPDNTTGRQEPAVSIEWIGSPTAKVGQPTDYSLVVRNACNIAVQQVVVRVRIPAGMNVASTEPRAANESGVLVWELGTLVAKQERALNIKVVAEAKGDVTPQAWVTFTGSSAIRIKVREPKLMVKCSAPEKVLVGDPAAFTITVSNPGDGSAGPVKIHATLSEGLEHARGNKIDFDIGNLAAGESRNVTLLCATRAGGTQKCEAVAEAEGNLNSKDSVGVNVIMPRLDLQLTGPGLRFLGRKGLYTLKVTNPGDAPATNVTVADVVPAGFKVLAASDGGRHDFQTRAVSWFLGEIGPGQTRSVQLEVEAINPGEHKHKAIALGARGLRTESEWTTRVEGLSALAVELVDTDDPIEVGGETSYEVRISNTGSKKETDIKLVVTVPDKMQFKNAQGPARYREEGKTLVFDPIDNLAPRADAIFRINVRTLDAGTVRFKIQVTSTNLTEPVVKMEATRIYSDTPEPSNGVPAAGSAPAATPAGAVPVGGPAPIPFPVAGVPGPGAPVAPTPDPVQGGGIPPVPGAPVIPGPTAPPVPGAGPGASADAPPAPLPPGGRGSLE